MCVRFLFALPLILFFPQASFSADKDSNVVVSASKELYEFVWQKSANNVQVKQSLTTSYYCNSYRTTIPVAEMYDNETSIDDVDFTVDGKKPKDIKPQYSYYSVDDIFYSDEHICFFPLPLEKKGSSSTVSFKKTISDPRYFINIFFSEPYMVMNKEVNIKVPRWMKVELKEMNFKGYQISKSSHFDNGKTTYFNTVADQYAWYHQLVSNIGSDEAAVKAKAQEITSGITNDLDKIKAVFYWMQKNIRYVAIDDGIAGFRPDKENEVIRKKYGDCIGMANATKGLLKCLVYDSRLCWIGTNHIAYDYSTLSLSVDNHMICALKFQGKMYFLDATENYLGFNEYAERIQGRQCLIEDGDKYILTNIPSTTYEQNSDEEKRILSVNGTDLKGTATHEWKGEEKEYNLTELNAVKKDKSEESFIRYLSNNNKDYILTDLKTSDVNNFDKNLTVSYSVNYKNAVSSFGKDYYVDLDFGKEMNDYRFDTSKRDLDYWFPYKTNVIRETQLIIPAGYTVTSLPPSVEIKNANYEFTITYTQTADKLIYKKNLIIKNTKLVKSEFTQWNKDIEKLVASYNEQIVLTAK